MRYIKRLIKSMLKIFNIGVLPIDNSTAYIVGPLIKIKSYPTFFKRLLLHNYNPTNDEAIKELVKNENPTIFDIGANIGDSIDRFQKLFQNPFIYSFEPIKNEYKLIKEKETKNIKCFNFAFGEREEHKKLNICTDSHLSSFNDYNNEISRNSSKDYKDTVQIRTLDNFLNERNEIDRIDLLKIDTQGYEEKVLEGAKSSLKKNIFKIIEVELQIGKLYDGPNKNFIDLEKYLIDNNYRLFSIDRFGNLLQTPTLEFNLIYICKKDFNL